jgi:uridine phosphorylase
MDNMKASELIINPDGSIYHLKLKPGELAGTVLLVGDPGRVETVSALFDRIDFKRQNREIVTHTGWIGDKRITVLSTGMGTDNIDIVLNELDALVNIDFKTRLPKQELTKLNLIRLGTTGSVQAEIPVNSFIVSEYGLGIDTVLNFYSGRNELFDEELSGEFIKQTNWDTALGRPYVVKANAELISFFSDGFVKGFTATAPGFYGPQGRVLRAALMHPDLNDRISSFEYRGLRITNFEMETSALYGLSAILGHRAVTICLVIANRATGKFNDDYKKTMKELIEQILQIIVAKC